MFQVAVALQRQHSLITMTKDLRGYANTAAIYQSHSKLSDSLTATNQWTTVLQPKAGVK